MKVIIFDEKNLNFIFSVNFLIFSHFFITFNRVIDDKFIKL